MRVGWLMIVLAGCPWISGDALDQRYDPDGDGVPWPDDCDDGDAGVTVPLDGWRDSDGDGLGDPEQLDAHCAAALPDGWVDNPDDCDDTDPGLPTLRWEDADDDGVGNPAVGVITCELAGTAAPGAEDCDDTNGAVYPGHAEVCDDGLDNDCDGTRNACVLAGDRLPSNAALRLVDTQYGGFGAALGAADFLGGPALDLAVGAPDRDPLYSGAVLLFEGPLARSLTPVEAPSVATALLAPAPSGALFGSSLLATSGRLVVGAPGDNPLEYDAGAFYVYDDPGSGVATTTVFGLDPGAMLGFSLAAVGDDLVVGAPGIGRVYLLEGPLAPGEWVATPPDWQPALTLYHGMIYGFAAPGYSLAAADTTGDGVAEIVVGDYAFDGGTLFVVPSDATGLVQYDAFESLTLSDTFSYSALGWSVATPGDLDGDGTEDLVGGAPAADQGAAWVISGALRDGPVLQGPLTGEGYGFEVGGAGDVDGDGFADLVVLEEGPYGSTGTGYLYYGRPMLQGLEGDTPDARFQGLDFDGYVHADIAGGDLDGDGVGDVGLGTPGDLGAVLVFAGVGI